MAYRRHMHYADGEVLAACSICGCSYLWPSELVRADDRLFYCTRTCWHPEWQTKTKLEDAQVRAAFRVRDDQNPHAPVLKADWQP